MITRFDLHRARLIRRKDRKENELDYPLLTYPELYILEGGYRSFYESLPAYCSPSAYVPMKSNENLFAAIRKRYKDIL